MYLLSKTMKVIIVLILISSVVWAFIPEAEAAIYLHYP